VAPADSSDSTTPGESGGRLTNRFVCGGIYTAPSSSAVFTLSALRPPYVVPAGDSSRFLLSKVNVNNTSTTDVSLITGRSVSPVVTDLDNRTVVFPGGNRAKAYGISIRSDGATEWDMDIPLIRCDRAPGTPGRLAAGTYRVWAEMELGEDPDIGSAHFIATGGPWEFIVR
jgi:hypothetical protein